MKRIIAVPWPVGASLAYPGNNADVKGRVSIHQLTLDANSDGLTPDDHSSAVSHTSSASNAL